MSPWCSIVMEAVAQMQSIARICVPCGSQSVNPYADKDHRFGQHHLARQVDRTLMGLNGV